MKWRSSRTLTRQSQNSSEHRHLINRGNKPAEPGHAHEKLLLKEELLLTKSRT